MEDSITNTLTGKEVSQAQVEKSLEEKIKSSKSETRTGEVNLVKKDNKWTIEILSKLPVPSIYTTENVINALNKLDNKLDNKLLDNQIDNQTLIKEWKFWIPTIIAISSSFMAFGSLICSIINILSN